MYVYTHIYTILKNTQELSINFSLVLHARPTLFVLSWSGLEHYDY